ncbi:MAG TPA: hypothetical protein VK879_11905 [Candidatus Sulfomarinibacteraceae bacterium]|nr:hypothetical protein [Candidatus Sulfomarinibacteraceae bacterium]
MSTWKLWPSILVLLPLLALAGCADGAVSGTLIWEGEHVYEPGQRVQGHLAVVEGRVVVPEGAQVAGSIYMLGGDVEVAGEVSEDVTMIGGDLQLGPSARIGGDLSVGGGELERAAEATVLGQVLVGGDVDVSLDTLFPQRTARQRLLQLLPEALMVAALAYLLARFVHRPLSRVSQTSVEHPFVATAMGALVTIVGPALLVLMAFTVILIPVSVIGLLLAGLVVAYSWSALGLALGQWLRRRLGRDWSAPATAFVGAFVFITITNLLVFIPLIGGWIGILATIVGVGGVFLTRFGLREFVPRYDFAPPREMPS